MGTERLCLSKVNQTKAGKGLWNKRGWLLLRIPKILESGPYSFPGPGPVFVASRLYQKCRSGFSSRIEFRDQLRFWYFSVFLDIWSKILV